MLVADKLVFVEFRNTGASHVERLLHSIAGGAIDKAASPSLLDLLSDKRVLFGSVRDPWGWYLSLWAAGCAQRGELYKRLTSDRTWQKLLSKVEAGSKAGDIAGGAEEGKKGGLLPDKLGAQRAKDFWYADAKNPVAFREWLRVVCAPQARRVVDPAYAQSSISKIAGLMTYRYFVLYVRGGAQMPVTISTQASLRAFGADHLVARHIIRQDSLTEDLVSALAQAGVTLDDAQRKLIYDARPSTRDRRHDIEQFYDAQTVDLVARKEKYIIDRFGYQRPPL
jgi:hypothetical protein